MARNNLTPEEKAARAAARAEKKAAVTASSDITQTTPAPDAEPSTAQAADVPVESCQTAASPATAFADTPAELATRIATAEASAAEKNQSVKPETKNRLEQEAARILTDYPDAAEICMTADGFGFFREQDARNHAETLRDKSILTAKRK